VSIDVVLYAKPGCHLCEDVADWLEQLGERRPLRVTTIDITADFELHRRYWDRIPVVQIGDQTLAAPIEPRALAAAIEVSISPPARPEQTV
jgi:hypothetical protein